MDIIIHSEGFTLYEKVRSQAEHKVARIELHDQRIIRARVTLKRLSAHASDTQFAAAVLLEVPGNDIRAEQKAGAPLTALDLVLDKVEHQMSRKKTAMLSKRTQKPKNLDVGDILQASA